MTIWRMGVANWIHKATNTHSGYVTRIAYPRQQWLHERAPVLRLYVHCMLCYNDNFGKTTVTSNAQCNFYVSITPYALWSGCVRPLKTKIEHVL